MAEALLTQLLLDKMQRDRALKERDAAWARDDARYNQQRQDRLDQEAHRRKQEQLDLERRAKLDEIAAADRQRAIQKENIGLATNPVLQPFGAAEQGGLGRMTSDTMMRNSSRILPDSSQSPVFPVGDQLFRVRSEPELAAQKRSQSMTDALFKARLGEMEAQQKIAIAGQGVEALGKMGLGDRGASIPGVVSQTGAPRPVQPPRGAVTDAQNARVNAAVQRYVQGDPTKGQTGTNPALLQAEDLPGEAAFIAEREGVPFDDVFRLLKMMFDANRSRDTGSTGGGGMFDTYMKNRGGGSAPPLE